MWQIVKKNVKVFLMQFPYSKQNGILRHFYDKDNNYFVNSISIFSSGEYVDSKTINAFIFDSDSYWFDNNHRTADTENYIGFCFKTGKATLIGHEISASPEPALPFRWSLSGSNDQIHWRGNSTVEHKMSANEIYYSPWTKGTFRCFRFDMLRNVYSSFDRAIDIKQIEVFGTYYLTDPKFCECYRYKRSTSIVSIIICLIIQS